MILQESLSEEWIRSILSKKDYSRANPPVLEKMIYALALLEKLTENGLEFTFKGGTSLVLLFNNFRRFSTDIDIITTKNKVEIETHLSQITENSVFNAYKLDKERSNANDIPKAHYSVFFNSAFNKDTVASVTLDILYEANPYPQIIERQILCNWLKTAEPYLNVKLPDIDSILGDKLTAFAPNTIGIPYYRSGNSMNTEIIKQLFDISNLIDNTANIKNINDSFNNIVANQIKYRNKTLSKSDIYDDIFHTSIIIAKRDNNKEEPDKTYFSELQKGIISFNQFLATGSFRIEDAIIASAKATWITSILKTQKFDAFIKYNPVLDLTDFSITNLEYNFLNRFKRTNKEAFYYWYKTLELLNLIN